MGCVFSKEHKDSPETPCVVVGPLAPPPSIGPDWPIQPIQPITIEVADSDAWSSDNSQSKPCSKINNSKDFWGKLEVNEQYPQLVAPSIPHKLPKQQQPLDAGETHRATKGQASSVLAITKTPDQSSKLIGVKDKKPNNNYNKEELGQEVSVYVGKLPSPPPWSIRVHTDEDGEKFAHSKRKTYDSNTKSKSANRIERADIGRGRRATKTSNIEEEKGERRARSRGQRPSKSRSTERGRERRQRRSPSKKNRVRNDSARARRPSWARSTGTDSVNRRRRRSRTSRNQEGSKRRQRSNASNKREENERRKRRHKAERKREDKEEPRHNKKTKQPTCSNYRKSDDDYSFCTTDKQDISDSVSVADKYGKFGPPPRPLLAPRPPSTSNVPMSSATSPCSEPYLKSILKVKGPGRVTATIESEPTVSSKRINNNNYNNKNGNNTTTNSKKNINVNNNNSNNNNNNKTENNSIDSNKTNDNNTNKSKQKNIINNIINKYKTPTTTPSKTEECSIYNHPEWPTMGDSSFINGTDANTQNNFLLKRWNGKHKKSDAASQNRTDEPGMNIIMSICPEF